MAIGRNLLVERTLHVPLIAPPGDGVQRKRYVRRRFREENSRSDRVRDVDEHVAHAEARFEQLAEAADPERLGRVVAGGDEVDAGLARLRQHVLLRLAGEERVEPEVDRLAKAVGGGAADDAERSDRGRAGVERERRALRDALDA